MAGHELHYTPPMPSFDKPVRLLIVVAPYYKDIADNLVAGAMAVAAEAGATVDLIEVPGALEVPTAIGMGSRGLTLLGLQGVCIGNGILTVENRKQAEVRADPADQNKGGGAAAAALHLVALSRKWAGRTKGIGFRPQGESFRIAGETEGPSQA